MKMSPVGRAFLQGTEGLSLVAYPDADGWSIGYGHAGVKEGDRITRAQADALFAQDLAVREQGVSELVASATPGQFDAMVSLAYNVGVPRFSRSTVLRLHRAGDTAGAADAFRLFRLSQGKVNPVLVARRERERHLYLTGDPGPVVHVSPQPMTAVRAAPVLALLLACGVAFAAYSLLPKLAPARRLLALG
jgi:lysozyme